MQEYISSNVDKNPSDFIIEAVRYSVSKCKGTGHPQLSGNVN
jgi:hypothetical protein